MNITFFIGNGFDLNLGLKTSYYDFLNYFTKRYPDNLISKLINNDYRYWSDLEFEIGKKVNICRTIDEFNQYLDAKDELDSCLSKYLLAENARFSINDRNQLASIFRANILGISKDFNPLEKKQFDITFNSKVSNRFNFINFNYTDTFDSIVASTKKTYSSLGTHEVGATTYYDKIEQVIHVHGNLNKDMILGVNDESQIINTHLKIPKYLLNYLIKPKCNDLTENSVNDIVSTIISNSDYICIFGMSIGKTDKKWWDLILKWLTSNSSKKIVFYKKLKNTVPVSAPARMRIERKTKEELLRKLGYSQLINTEELLDQIIVVFNTNIFDIKGVKIASRLEPSELSTVK